MPARRNAIPTIALQVRLPEDLYNKTTMHLYSEVEGRVPHAAWQRLISRLLREHFDHVGLDLAPFIGTPPGTAIIRGRPDTIDALRQTLSEPSP